MSNKNVKANKHVSATKVKTTDSVKTTKLTENVKAKAMMPLEQVERIGLALAMKEQHASNVRRMLPTHVIATSESKRVCVLCSSDKTTKRMSGKSRWHMTENDNEWLCHKCYNHSRLETS